MQAQAFRQLNEQEQITLTQSQVAVKTLLSASFGCILFLRTLLPEENFGQTHLVVGDNKSILNSDTPGSSQASSHNVGNKTSRYKIMTVKRGYSQEGDEILDYLEKGAFDALEKQYLRRMIFAIYLDKEDPQNIVEAWNFDFTYHQIPGTSVSLPMMSMSDSNSGTHKTSGAPVVSLGKEVRAPTLGEVKGNIRSMVQNLIAFTQTLDDLPKKRFATFKLEYYPHTPDEYEPPLFVAADPGRSKLTLSTHHVAETPLRFNVGKVNAGFSSISLDVHSVAGALPVVGEEEDSLHVLGAAPQIGGKSRVAETFESSDTLAIDAAERNVVWDAEVQLDGRSGKQGDNVGLLGERRENGEIEPVSKAILGKQAPLILHVDHMEQTPSSDFEETQLGDSVTSRLPGFPLSSPSRSVSKLSTTTGDPKFTSDPDFADTLGRLKLTGHDSPRGSPSHSQEVMDLETQQAFASWTSDEMPKHADANGKNHFVDVSIKEAPKQHDESIARDRIANGHIEEPVNCDCAIKKDAEDYDVCQCDGACGRWIHLWCHGYHGAKDPRLPDSFRCFECRLRNTQASLVKGETLIMEYVLKYAELALFRRALKIIEVENPSNATEFRKMIGCNPPVAAQLWKRLESEGFIGPESVEEDAIGIFESRIMVSRKVGKSKIRKTAKTKYIKNPLLERMIAPYFDPSEEAERQHVGLGRKHRANPPDPTEERTTGPLQAPTRLGTNQTDPPLSSSRVHNSSQGVFQGVSDTFSPNGAAMMDVDERETPRNSPVGKRFMAKRKAKEWEPEEAGDGLNLRRSKRIKVSVPQKNVDLEG